MVANIKYKIIESMPNNPTKIKDFKTRQLFISDSGRLFMATDEYHCDERRFTDLETGYITYFNENLTIDKVYEICISETVIALVRVK